MPGTGAVCVAAAAAVVPSGDGRRTVVGVSMLKVSGMLPLLSSSGNAGLAAVPRGGSLPSGASLPALPTSWVGRARRQWRISTQPPAAATAAAAHAPMAMPAIAPADRLLLLLLLGCSADPFAAPTLG